MSFDNDEDITVENLQKCSNWIIRTAEDIEVECEHCGSVSKENHDFVFFGTLEDAEKIAKEEDGKIVGKR